MRSGAIDAVRVAGICAVVMGHCVTEPWVRPALYSWHVPLFFILAGYFWSENRSLKSEIIARARSLGRPYLSWLLLIAVVFIPLDSTLEGFNPGLVTAQFQNGQNSAMSYSTFWFVSVLLFAVILRRVLQVFPRPLVWALAGLGAIAAPAIGTVLAQTPLAVGSALPCMAFLFLGSAARSVRSRVTRPGLIGAALLAVSAAALASGLVLPVDIKQGNYGTPILSMISAAMISLGLILCTEAGFARLPTSIGPAATGLASAGFVVVLVHPFILWFLLNFVPALTMWPVFVITLSVAWLIALVAQRTVAAPWLTGSSRVAL
jgi:acyltransferase